MQSGIIWEKLERKLKENGLSVRAIPSSAPSSTVGGWLAQSGAGYGSYEFGWGYESMEKARVVLPTGEIREFSGPELKKVNRDNGNHRHHHRDNPESPEVLKREKLFLPVSPTLQPLKKRLKPSDKRTYLSGLFPS